MKLAPQEENGIVAMMLRDINDVLRNIQNFNFAFASGVKKQKVIFSLADKLRIPITRSWYRHGGYVHNNLISVNKLSREPRNILGVTDEEISHAEQLIQPFKRNYENLLNELVPDYFLMALPDLLAFFYKKAPEPYQHLYFVNLDMEKTFNVFEISREYGAVTFQEVITKFGKSGQHDFTYYKNFTSILSELSLIMAELDNFSTMHKFTSEFIDLFEDFLVKVSLKENLMPTVFNLFKRIYKEAIWNPSSLIISLNTVVGTRYQQIKKEQEKRFVEEIPIIRYRLSYLKHTLADANIELSLEERTQFFNALYGNDKEVLGAIADVWETYKE